MFQSVTLVLREIHTEFEDLSTKLSDFKNCLWEGVGIKFHYEELKRKKKCSYVCENVIKTEMAGIKLSSRDNMKSAEWIGLA